MGITNFEEWGRSAEAESPFSDLSGCRLAIEASRYLAHLLGGRLTREPLLAAIGGMPFIMKRLIWADMKSLQQAGVKPIFVFSGCDMVQQKLFTKAENVARAIDHAWGLYDAHQADDAVSAFGDSNAIQPEYLFRFLQSILISMDPPIEFQVAPYSAWPQMVYLLKNGFVEALHGSSELLLFDIDKFIFSMDYVKKEFKHVRKAQLTKQFDFGQRRDLFEDACLLAGCAYLPTIPPLESKKVDMREISKMISGMGGTGLKVCYSYERQGPFREQMMGLRYADRFKKAKLAVKHEIIIWQDGKIGPRNVETAPGDIHEYIGQRLPEEILYYLSKGVVGPRVLNWRTSNELVEYPPLDNGTSEVYHKLVKSQMIPLRTDAISLLSHSLNRYYQHKDITVRTWFDRNSTFTINIKDAADPRPIISSWNVKDNLIREKWNAIGNSGNLPSATLRFAIKSLSDPKFAAKTITPKNNERLLQSTEEICNNSLWRFLHLRGYINSSHELTKWGEVLHAALEKVEGTGEPILIAVELLRLNLLTAANMFPSYTGAPTRGSDIDRKNAVLLSRVACLGSLNHREIGFTGPLSRDLLAYNSVIATIRGGLRDLAEMSLLTMFVNGDATRERNNWTELGLGLPFLFNNDCGLGIAVKTYLEELHIHPSPTAPDPTSLETRQLVKQKCATIYFPQSVDLAKDISSAFKLWDAVYAGVQAAGGLVKDSQMWHEVDSWLKDRR